MNVPYNNGKVQIGKYYQKPPYVEEDPDMLQIQGWLIGDKSAVKMKFYGNLSYVCLLLVSFFLAVLYG